MIKQTPAEIIAAWRRWNEIDQRVEDSDPGDGSLMHGTRIGCADDIETLLLAYLETVVQEAMDLLEMNRAYRRPTVAEVLASATAKFREGT